MSQDAESGEHGGLSLRGFFLTGIRLAHNRLQILSTEIAEEKIRLSLAAITGIAGLFLLGLAVVLGTILLLLLFWETHRIAVLSILTAGFALVGGLLISMTVRALSRKETPFAITLGELKKDERAWRAAQSND